MKALTLTQPWASLVACGAKRIETRSFQTRYRGPLAIHAAKGFPGHAKTLCEARMVCGIFGWPEFTGALTQEWLDDNARRIKTLPLGCVVATCLLSDILPTEPRGCLPGIFDDYPEFDTEQEQAFGNYEPGRWAWLLADIKALSEPVPAKGALSLWEWKP